MPTREELRTRLFLRAALPLTKVVLDERPAVRKRVGSLCAVVQFRLRDGSEGAYLQFTHGALEVVQGQHEQPTVTLEFKTREALNAFFAGKLAIPRVRRLKGLPALLRVLPLLMSLKILMPAADPRSPELRALKVKLLLYMVTVALSQLNQAGDETMVELTRKSPDRVYQWTVADGPSVYLRMRAGKTKAGKGVYTRRRPFVLMKFPSLEGAYQVLTSKVALVEAVKRGYVVTEGAMEYSKEMGLRMQHVEELLA